MKKITKVTAVFAKDEDGHDYVIHEDDEELFYEMLNDAYLGYGEKYDKFVEKFSPIGMSLSLYRKEYLK